MVYDYLVIGGGSGGLASARRASKLYNAKVAIIKSGKWGGTCVNVGCVPKKLCFNVALISDFIAFGRNYGISSKISFDWNYFKLKRDAYVKRLNGIYQHNLSKDNVEAIVGHAKFVGQGKVEVNGNVIEAKHILIASGSHPRTLEIPGKEYLLNSNGFFELEQLPKKALIVGGGYIAVELCGILHSLGSEVFLALRHDIPLRTFDHEISRELLNEMESSGIKILKQVELLSVTSDNQGLSETDLTTSVHAINLTAKFRQESSKNVEISGLNTIITAIGRVPNIDSLNLEAVNVKIDNDTKLIIADKYQNTTSPNVYAVGDVCGPLALTPVAIAAGRRLADRLFGGLDSYLDYDNVPTVVFSHPPIGTIGLTEEAARKKYEKIKVYRTRFVNMFFAMEEKKQYTLFKVVCSGDEEKVVGLHLFGMGSDEILQGFGVAIKMGIKKKDLDSCVAIHPTAAEELVTLV